MTPSAPSRLRTAAQIAASRTNGAQSQGPTTSAGRHRSSRNATKHGFSGQGLVLPPSMQQELQSEIDLFITQFRPTTDYEHALIRRAALGNLRARRIAETLNALVDENVRLAIPAWDESRAEQIDHLAELLPTNPATATRKLRQTAEGCDYLADTWETLATTLQTHGSWTQSEALRALHLLGAAQPPTTSDPLADFWLVALDATSPTTSPETLDSLLTFIRDQITALATEADHLWTTQDHPARQSAAPPRRLLPHPPNHPPRTLPRRRRPHAPPGPRRAPQTPQKRLRRSLRAR